LILFNSIPPTYAPAHEASTGKPLTNRQKIALAVTMLFVFLVFILFLLLHR